MKRNGIYDQVVAILREAGKTIVENPGVMSNPTLEKLHEGVKIARENDVDLILSLGGGSVCDYSKGVAASAGYDGDYWNQFWLQQQNPAQEQKILPIGCILTMAGTGSEMNGGSVITDAEHKLKVGRVFDNRLMPKFSILNPKFTMTVPDNQMKAGIYDIMNHIMEQYFSDTDDNTSDYLSEGLMRGLIVASRKAVENPQDYEARSNIMWTATWALNTLIGLGKHQDWMVHMIGHSVGAWTHAPHGYALAAVSMAYYRRAMQLALVLSIVLCLSVVVIGILIWTRPTPVFFAATRDLRLAQMVPLDKPVLTQQGLLNWATETVTNAVSLDFLEWRKKLTAAREHFSEGAYKSFLESLQSSGILSMIQEKRLSASAVVTQAPVIVASGMLDGKASWKIEFPIIISYESSQGVESTQKLLAVVLVRRASTVRSPRGVVVEQVVLKRDA